MSLSSDQPPPSTALPPASQTQVFQPVSKVPHSSGINVNAAPFQSMQTVRLRWSFLFLKLNTKQVSCCKTMPVMKAFKMMIYDDLCGCFGPHDTFSSPAKGLQRAQTVCAKKLVDICLSSYVDACFMHHMFCVMFVLFVPVSELSLSQLWHFSVCLVVCNKKTNAPPCFQKDFLKLFLSILECD